MCGAGNRAEISGNANKENYKTMTLLSYQLRDWKFNQTLDRSGLSRSVGGDVGTWFPLPGSLMSFHKAESDLPFLTLTTTKQRKKTVRSRSKTHKEHILYIINSSFV